MGANNGQPWPVPCNQIKPCHPAAIEADICRLLRVQAVHDAGVKKENHVILVGTIVDRPVGWVVVVPLRGCNLTEAPKSRPMKAVNLAENVRIIQPDISKTYQAVRMFPDELSGLRETLGRGQQESQAIRSIQFIKQLFEKPLLAVVVHMHVDKFWRMGLGKD